MTFVAVASKSSVVIVGVWAAVVYADAWTAVSGSVTGGYSVIAADGSWIISDSCVGSYSCSSV